MSCISTFYLFEKDQRKAIIAAEANGKREVVTKRFLLFTRREIVGEKYFFEWLEENCIRHEDLNASGFIIVAITSEIYDAAEEINNLLFGDNLDEYTNFIEYDRAVSLLNLLRKEPFKDDTITSFLREEYNTAEEDLKGVVGAYRYTHQWLIKWLESISEDYIGVLDMSF